MKFNEVDINNLGSRHTGRLENFAAIPPNLKISSLQEKFPIINKILSMQDPNVTNEQMHSLQKVVEELLAEVSDNQKILHGEITYLETGEYPTVDLSSRAMPVYALKPRLRRVTEQHSIDNNLNELGLLSSPEDEEDAPASILDIPHRFWTWTRPYLRHIDDDFVKEFKEKIVDRFDEENLERILSQGHGSTSKKSREENGISRNGRSNQSSKASKRRIIPDDEILETPSRVARRDTRSSRSKNESTSKVYLAGNVMNTHQKERELKSKESKQVSFPVNGVECNMSNSYEDCNGDAIHCNGIKTNGYLPHSPLSSVAECDRHDAKKFGLELATYGMEIGLISPKTPSELLNDFDEESTCHALLNGDQDDDDDDPMDEVTREIKKKQRELRELLYKTKPIIMKLYERAETEKLLYEYSRSLDEADDKLIDLSTRYEHHEGVLNAEQRKECLEALATRETFAKLFNAHHHRSIQLQRLNSSPGKK